MGKLIKMMTIAKSTKDKMDQQRGADGHQIIKQMVARIARLMNHQHVIQSWRRVWFWFDMRTGCILRLVAVLVPTPPKRNQTSQSSQHQTRNQSSWSLVCSTLPCISNIKAPLFRCLFVFSLYLVLWLDCQYCGSLVPENTSTPSPAIWSWCSSLRQNKF